MAPSQISSDNPDEAYGPKWFIEFSEDGIKVPEVGYSKSWTMGEINGAKAYMRGYGIRQTANGPVKWKWRNHSQSKYRKTATPSP